MARFNAKEWRHVRGSGPDKPGGVIYEGSKPIRLHGETVEPGQRVSRRQYENLRYTQSGWQNKSQYEAVAKQRPPKGYPHEAKAYKRWMQDYAEETGKPLSALRGPDNPYSEAFAAAFNDKFRDNSPDSPFAQLLVLIGLREPDAPYNVGDTP